MASPRFVTGRGDTWVEFDRARTERDLYDPEGWLRHLAVRAALHYRRGRVYRQWGQFDELSDDVAAPTHTRPDVTCEATEAKRRVYEALAQLSESERRTLALRYLEELDYNDISFITGEREVTLRSKVHRGLHKLREVLVEEAA